jgi:hypothetical protein
VKLYVSTADNGRILLRARAEGDGIVGDMMRELGPGDSFAGVPFEWWTLHIGAVRLEDALAANPRRPPGAP